MFYGAGGPRVGELDEAQVHESRPGQNIVLGATTWRIESISRDRVIVAPAVGESGTLPFWRGEGPGRSSELGAAMGRFTRQILDDPQSTQTLATLGLDRWATQNLVASLQDQAAVSHVPTDLEIVVERFRDEVGDWRICILTPFGRRVHAPWALALEATIDRPGVQLLWTDDGIALRCANADEPLPTRALFPTDIEPTLVAHLPRSALFAGRFRDNAARALMLAKADPHRRQPLWAQRLRSQSLLGVAVKYPSFPIVLETLRECLQDVFDLDALTRLLEAVRRGVITVRDVETRSPSPFARGLAFRWVAEFLNAGDAPAAERRTQALTLDRTLLQQFLGHTALRDALDPATLAAITADAAAFPKPAANADEVHDLLRIHGDLSEPEVAARMSPGASAPVLLSRLRDSHRATSIDIRGDTRWICTDETTRYVAALGATEGETTDSGEVSANPPPLDGIVARFAQRRGPFTVADIVDRYGVSLKVAEAALTRLVVAGRLVNAPLLRDEAKVHWCDAELLRRWRQASHRRAQAEPVKPSTYARFLLYRHGMIGKRKPLLEVIDDLHGLPLPWSDWEGSVLPSRVADYRPAMLDELGLRGEVVWVGHGGLPGDGLVALIRRASLPCARRPVSAVPEGAAAVWRHLERHGACFVVDLVAAVGGPLEAVLDALWALAWSGLVTNDTVFPLRELTRRGSGVTVARQAGGRWATLPAPTASPTEVTIAHIRAILRRRGVVTPSILAYERSNDPITRAALRELEQHGTLQRGWFVEGLDSRQFSESAAMDTLRATPDTTEPSAVVLTASDAANPWGRTLAWPPATATPRAQAGYTIVLVDGQPAMLLTRGGRSAVTFDNLPAVAAKVVPAILQHLERTRRRSLRIETLDLALAAEHPAASALRAAGAIDDQSVLLLVRP